MPNIAKILLMPKTLYCNINPTNVLMATKIPSTIAVSFLSLFLVNNINSPRPPAVDNPAINEPKLIVCLIYNRVIATDTAQLGINPSNDTKNG